MDEGLKSKGIQMYALTAGRALPHESGEEKSAMTCGALRTCQHWTLTERFQHHWEQTRCGWSAKPSHSMQNFGKHFLNQLKREVWTHE